MRALPEDQRAKILIKYQSGATVSEISKELGISISTAYRVCEKHKRAVEKICKWCGSSFKTYCDGKQKFCTKTCAANADAERRRQKKRVCVLCYKEFVPTSSRQAYCSDCQEGPLTRRAVKETVELCEKCGAVLPEGRKGLCNQCRDNRAEISMKSISAVCREAKEHGMSYGEYIAYKRKTAVS